VAVRTGLDFALPGVKTCNGVPKNSLLRTSVVAVRMEESHRKTVVPSLLYDSPFPQFL
jgi:hypothetical protein